MLGRGKWSFEGNIQIPDIWRERDEWELFIEKRNQAYGAADGSKPDKLSFRSIDVNSIWRHPGVETISYYLWTGVYKYFSKFSGFSGAREVYKYFSGGEYKYFFGAGEVYKYFSGGVYKYLTAVYINTSPAWGCQTSYMYIEFYKHCC